jgi:hypothetical protein
MTRGDGARRLSEEDGRLDETLGQRVRSQTGQTGSAAKGRDAAMASSVGTAATAIPSAHARPLTALNPMRSPVKEPGPTATAKPSRLATGQPASRRRRSMAGIKRSECVIRTSRRYSPITRSPSSNATPPASVEVSTAISRTAASLARAPEESGKHAVR